MGRIFSLLKVQQRWTIEKLLNENCSITYIAKVIKVNKSTVSREIKRGTITIFTSNLHERNIYDALAGERIYKENRKNSFNKPKFKNNYLLMNSIENKIINDKFSPRAASYYIHDSLNIRISYSAIYRYIKHKYFKSITMKKLPYGNLIKYKKLYREQKRYNVGVNIFIEIV